MRKVAIVTGASRGIGRIVCHKLAENGYNLVIAAKSIQENTALPGTIYKVTKEIKYKYNVEVFPLQIDVRNCQDMREGFEYVVAKF